MKIKNNRSLDRQYFYIFAVMFGLIFVRFCCYGFSYWQQLDDYIQYHNYTAYNSDIPKLIQSLGLLSARPLAGLADLFVWSRFYGCMTVAVALISAMYAASAVLFHRVFSRHFGTGVLFLAVYALLPLGVEGTYWVSASSRIVVGLFFVSASLYYFDAWCRGGRVYRLLLFAVFQFAAFCLYEQMVLLSGGVTLIIMLLCLKERNRRGLWGFLMFAGAALYFLITKLAAQGAYSARSEFFLPWREGWLSEVAKPVFDQMLTVFTTGMWATSTRGLLRGLQYIISGHLYIYVIVCLLLCVAIYLLARRTRDKKLLFWPQLASGMFLFAVPTVLFFLIKAPWFGVRNAVPSFLGLALVADALFKLVFGAISKNRTAISAFTAAVCFLCCIASVSEMHDYRATTLADKSIASQTAEKITAAGWLEGDEVFILNVNTCHAPDASFLFHEHIYGVTAASWSLTGAVESFAGRCDLPVITAIADGSGVPREKALDPERTIFYYYDGESILNVRLEPLTETKWTALDERGTSVGIVGFEQKSLSYNK